MAAATRRNAVHTLLGFYYQFDLSIAEILRLEAADDRATIEGVEDIDLSRPSARTAVQCKYHAQQSYVPSRIRRPIQLMLEDFASRSDGLEYRLFVHFRDPDSIPDRLTLPLLKQLLTFKEDGRQQAVHDTLGLGDNELCRFLTRFHLVRGPSFDEQHNEVFRLLQREFSCTTIEAESYYYNVALRVVVDLATQPRMQDREITRAEFVKAIGDSEGLFSAWFARFRGTKEYLTFVAEQLAKQNALSATKRRAVYLGTELLGAAGKTAGYGFGNLVQDLQIGYFEPGRSLVNCQPWTFIVQVEGAALLRLKRDLLSRDIAFFDGYEHVAFVPTMFDTDPLKQRFMPSGQRASDRLGRTSFDVRVVSVATLLEHGARVRAPDTLIAFAPKDPGLEWIDEASVVHVPGIGSLADVCSLLKWRS